MTSNSIQETLYNDFDMPQREPNETEQRLIADYTTETGVANKLIRRIGRVNIDHPIIVKAFADFVKRSGEELESFRLLDLLSFHENVLKGRFVYGNVGDYILCFSKIPSDVKLSKEIYNNSVSGLYELIDRTNGITLDLTEHPLENISTLQNKRFVFASIKKAAALVSKAAAFGISVYFIGIVTSEKRVVIVRNNVAEIDLDKQLLYANDNEERLAVGIKKEMFEDYKKGFFAIFCYKYGISASLHNPVVLGTDIGFARLLSTLLGVYSASKVLFMASVRLLFSDEQKISIPIGTAPLREGDRLFLITPVCDSYGIPFSDSYNQINTYFNNLSVRGHIRALCPVLDYLNTAVEQLLGENYTLDKIVNFDITKKAPCSVLVVSNEDIDGRLIGVVRHKQVIDTPVE
ncbi:MAG: hypothetical protein CVU97_05355 [Firmicutes bacterium HGW-Firmicutes-21]|nr:MAG: hypothetical protein CVU97_05355 [Firmicutes bacterium HGW-Firmicutes-21]